MKNEAFGSKGHQKENSEAQGERKKGIGMNSSFTK